MAEFRVGEENNYGSNGTSSFFSLKEDGEIKQVRFMYNGSEDVKGCAVHEVMVNGKKRYVNCLRRYDEPLDNCPLCKNNSVQQAKVYIPIYDIQANKVCFWERGKKFLSRMASICARYPDTVSHIFEIERHGAKGDKETTYEIFEVGHDNTRLTDLPEIPKVVGSIVLDKTAADMNDYLRTGEFRQDANKTQNSNVTANYIPQRRTPVSTTEEF